MNSNIEKARVPTQWERQQPTLFPISDFSDGPLSPQDLCKRIGLNWMTALELHKEGLLTFDPKKPNQLAPWQEAELTFVGSLAAAGCDKSVLRTMLSGLPKPYAYHVDRVYYDWSTRAWRLLEDVDELEDKFDEWLSELVASQDYPLLSKLNEQIENAMLYLKGKRGMPLEAAD